MSGILVDGLNRLRCELEVVVNAERCRIDHSVFETIVNFLGISIVVIMIIIIIIAVMIAAVLVRRGLLKVIFRGCVEST